MGTNFYIYDTGLVNPVFEETETPFPTWENASPTQRMKGEFRISDNPLIFKINSINSGLKANLKIIPSLSSLKTKVIQPSIEPINYTIQGFIRKPLRYDINNKYDLDIYKYLHLLQFSKGHKDLYIKDDTNSSIEELFSIHYLIDIIGKEDNGNPDNKKHLNVVVNSISFNEGKKDITFSLNLVIIPYF